jgi:hypothetical protein
MATLQPVQIDELPGTREEFVVLHGDVARTPQGGAAAMIVALLVYTGDQLLGRQCLAVAADPSRVDEGERLRVRDARLIGRQIGKQTYLPRSYVKGATPENGYQLPDPPYVFEFSDNPHSGDPAAGPYKVFVACSGAASPRPITVIKGDGGLWRAKEWSTLVVGIRAPE